MEGMASAIFTSHSFLLLFFLLTAIVMLQVPAACASVHQEYDVHPRRFTLALGYWEQLTNGMANLFSLVRIGREWGARVVVPFATRAIVTGGGNISMDLLLDFDKINSDLLCNKHRLPEIVRFNYFLQYAVRNVTYIHMVWGGGQDESVIRCNWTTKHQEEFQSKINRLAKLANEPVFQITSTCCINPKKPVEPKVMIDNCGLLDHENSTVVFDEWRGHTNANSKDPRFFIPNVPESESPHPDSVFPVSEAVIANASAFKQSFAANKSFMAVHFRTAKLVQGTKKHISEVFQVIANLTSSNSHLSCFFFVDYGPYGIEDWEEDVARPVISQLETVRHIAPTRYDPSKFNGLNNAGFVSLVEKYAIAQAEVLVLAGGGSFQRELEEKYKKLHKSKYGQMHTIRYEAI